MGKQTSDAVKLEAIKASIKRWQTRARRAMNAIDRLGRQARYFERKIAEAPKPKALPAPAMLAIEPPKVADVAPLPPALLAEARATADLDDIPAFLRRSKPTEADAQAIAKIESEQAEHKRKKAQGRIAKLKATQSGETRKMPLTGKAALAAIRG